MVVGFVIHKDENDDRYGCGVQGPCETYLVKNLETLDIPSLGKVYLVGYVSNLGGTINYVALHQPVDSGTVPVLGENKYQNYTVDFSLPSKTGGRFTLRIFTNTEQNQNSKWTGMSYEEFYNSDSAQKGIKIFKSLSYQ